MSELSPDELKTLLGIAGSKVKDIAEGLERNWLIQMVCAGVGLALVFDIGGLPELICKYFGGRESCSPHAVGTVLLVIELYYFMKFGQFLTAFIEAKSLQERLLESYVSHRVGSLDLSPLQDSLSFCEGYYSRNAFASWGPLRVAYFLLAVLVIALGQSSALVLVLRGYGLSGMSIAGAVAAATCLIVLYVGFWRRNRHHHGTTPIVLGCVALLVLTASVFWALGHR